MNNSKKITYIKILSAIFISIIAVNLLSSQIFLANSPRLRPNLGNYLIVKLKNLTIGPNSFLANLFTDKSKIVKQKPTANTEKQVANIPYNQIAKGVYAKEQGNITYKLYKDNEVDWLEYRFVYKNKEYVIKYAAGDTVPNKELFVKLLE